MTTTSLRATETPAGELVGYFEPGTPDWHAARAHGIGGSEIAAILGLSPFESPFSLWHRKAGNIPPVSEAPEMEWGKRLEPAICGKYADAHPEYDVRQCGTYRSESRPWQIANPDRLAFGRRPGRRVAAGIFEAKTAQDDALWGEPGSDTIPVHYRAQCLWYMDVLGFDAIDVGVLIRGCEYREYTVLYDLAEAVNLREQAEEFMASLRDGVAPPLDGHEATFQAVRELHPDIDGRSIEIDARLAHDYEMACLDVKDAEAAKKAVVIRMLAAMGSARTATYMGERIALRQPNGTHKPKLCPAPGLLKEKAAA